MELFGLGTSEILLILVVILLLFGKDKLPELARSIGKSFKELKSGFEKTSDVLDPTKPDTKALSVEEKAKEVERQRLHLIALESELTAMKKETVATPGKQKNS